MPSSELLIAFAVAMVIFAFMLGPAMLYTAAQTLARGRKGGFMAAFGIHCGGYVHVLGAMLGLSSAALTRLRRSDTAQRILRWIGGSVLVGLGAHMAASRA